jgi:hypothetical protein
LINSAGIFWSQAMLGQHALICVLTATVWCVISIVALKLVHWDDWSTLGFGELSCTKSQLG